MFAGYYPIKSSEVKNIPNKLLRTTFAVGLMLLLFPELSLGQKTINRLIIWDVTNSMVGTTNSTPPDYGYKLASDIDKNVRDGIIKIINDAKDDGGAFRILPFTTTILDTDKNFVNNSSGRAAAVNYILNYVIGKKPSGYTNICGAWDGAMSFVDPTRQNIIYLFTDGNQNVPYGNSGINCLTEVVSRYCKVTLNSDIYTFFISLNIQDNSFSQILNNACSKHLKYLSLDDVKGKGIKLPVSLFAMTEPLIFNLQDRTVSVIERFNCIGGDIPNDFSMDAQLDVGQQYSLDIRCLVKSNKDNKLDVEFSLEDFSGNKFQTLINDPHLNIQGILKPNSKSDNISFASSEIKMKIINKKPEQLNFVIK